MVQYPGVITQSEYFYLFILYFISIANKRTHFVWDCLVANTFGTSYLEAWKRRTCDHDICMRGWTADAAGLSPPSSTTTTTTTQRGMVILLQPVAVVKEAIFGDGRVVVC